MQIYSVKWSIGMSTTSIQLYSRRLLLYSVYCALYKYLYPGTSVYSVDCVHRVHTVDCTACRLYAVKYVHLYIFTFVQYTYCMYTHCSEIN
jgi:hypothetical protein